MVVDQKQAQALLPVASVHVRLPRRSPTGGILPTMSMGIL
jgi:hypothetical protein